MTIKDIYFLGYMSDVAGAYLGSAKGPDVLRRSPYLAALEKQGIKLHWEEFLQPDPTQHSKLEKVSTLCKKLSDNTQSLNQENKFFIVLGGDHTSAIGTWSGVTNATQGDLGLIWIDAHMDSHTPQTSETGNIHGMPLACLLGEGVFELTQLANKSVKFKAQNVCLIGVRSFEQAEAELLRQLNVRIFFMDEVKQKGLYKVMQEAIQHVTRHTVGFGVSLDIDSIDPQDAPGTGITEHNGLDGKELTLALSLLADNPNLVGAEIVEFDPSRDKDHLTEKLIANLIQSLAVSAK
jgi:arginase